MGHRALKYTIGVEGLTTQKMFVHLPKLRKFYANFTQITQILRKLRKIYAKYAKFTQITQILRKNSA